MKKGPEISRRSFLKIAGSGTVGLAILPALSSLSVGAAEENITNFHFLAISVAIDGADTHNFLMGGDGKITPGNVVGNGSFQHQLASKIG